MIYPFYFLTMCGADASAAADAKSFKLNGLMAAERRGVGWVAELGR